MIDVEWRLVPAGPFRMGSDPSRAYPPAADESPRRVVEVAPFRIGKISVTNGQRVWNLHAAGGASGLGTSPSRIRRTRRSLRSGSAIGIADSSASV